MNSYLFSVCKSATAPISEGNLETLEASSDSGAVSSSLMLLSHQSEVRSDFGIGNMPTSENIGKDRTRSQQCETEKSDHAPLDRPRKRTCKSCDEPRFKVGTLGGGYIKGNIHRKRTCESGDGPGLKAGKYDFEMPREKLPEDCIPEREIYKCDDINYGYEVEKHDCKLPSIYPSGSVSRNDGYFVYESSDDCDSSDENMPRKRTCYGNDGKVTEKSSVLVSRVKPSNKEFFRKYENDGEVAGTSSGLLSCAKFSDEEFFRKYGYDLEIDEAFSRFISRTQSNEEEFFRKYENDGEVAGTSSKMFSRARFSDEEFFRKYENDGEIAGTSSKLISHTRFSDEKFFRKYGYGEVEKSSYGLTSSSRSNSYTFMSMLRQSNDIEKYFGDDEDIFDEYGDLSRFKYDKYRSLDEDGKYDSSDEYESSYDTDSSHSSDCTSSEIMLMHQRDDDMEKYLDFDDEDRFNEYIQRCIKLSESKCGGSEYFDKCDDDTSGKHGLSDN
ncbi:hypothetical protein [Candidatus Ichthyocystis hellenicum]|uniref:hypothetical protein n=1 Tax=Candidatus Ichthyocystis hellenicum TaxID=1561003 RepID=UPI0011119274|nr:hypothetical protein [Candidatus Ichthyocystis hellenicum]